MTREFVEHEGVIHKGGCAIAEWVSSERLTPVPMCNCQTAEATAKTFEHPVEGCPMCHSVMAAGHKEGCPMTPNEDPSMKRYFGVQPGGGLINIYHFEKDAFGVIGSRSIENIFNEIKRERKQSFNAVRAMLLGFKMVKGKSEKILSISCGVDPLGNEILVVVTQEGNGIE